MKERRMRPIRFMSRRQAALTIAGFLSALAARPAFAASQEPKAMRFFTPDGAGERAGHNWANAMPLSRLNQSLANAQPGWAFRIGFDPSGKPALLDRDRIMLSASGKADSPLFIEAGLMTGEHEIADATKDTAPFLKAHQPWSLENFKKKKGIPSFLALNKGASHLRISGFRVDGTSADGFIKFRAKKDAPADFDDIVISGLDAKNVGRIIETERGAMLSNVTIENCRAFGIVRGFSRIYHLNNGVFRNLELDAANFDAGTPNVCQLLAVDAGDNILFEDVTLKNALNIPTPKAGKKEGYVQGDGITCELKTSNVTIRRCHGNGMGDGAFDIKTKNVTIEDSSADSCKFGARIWTHGENVIRRCDFKNPQTRAGTKGACIQVGGTVDIVDTTLHAGGDTAAISVHKLDNREAPVVRMHGGAITLENNGAEVRATSSGVLELHDVAVNGTLTNRRFDFKGNG
jgi:hypothetical protein